MNNRNSIKWAPFESLFTSDEMLNEIEEEQSIISKPILSEEELNDIDSKIKESYHTNELIKVTYFYQGKIKNKTSKIIDIKKSEQKIKFIDHSYLFFEQILKIQIL